jgi:ABC-2 type transport system ATP-binding protein
MASAIETSGLTRHYRDCEAVQALDLAVPAGSAFAFLGRNGAGKTTTIKMLAGLIRPTAGQSRLLGHDSAKLRPGQWREIGYVSENQELYDWMTCEELVRFTAALYPSWDGDFEASLKEMLDLSLQRRVGRCSRGERMKLALLLAIAFRPRLLILDEPFTGLDPLVKEEILGSLIEITAQNEWTIFFSTHDIDEVEKLADHVGIIEEGRLQVSESMATLQDRFRRIEVHGPVAAEPPPDALAIERAESRLRFILSRFSGDEEAVRVHFVPARVEISPMSLKEIFLTLAKEYQREKRGR